MLRWRLAKIQKKTSQPGPDGPVETWTDVETLYARAVPLSAQARVEYQALQSQATHQVILRGSININLADHRIAIGGKTFYPAAPPVDAGGLGRYTTVVVQEKR